MHGMNEIVYIAHSFISHVENLTLLLGMLILLLLLWVLSIVDGRKLRYKSIVLFCLYHTYCMYAHIVEEKKSHNRIAPKPLTLNEVSTIFLRDFLTH